MIRSLKRRSISRENSRLLGIVTAVVAISALYFARVVFIPLALALLVALLLTPSVSFLERIKFPRTIAIFTVVLALLGLLGAVGWQAFRQFVDLTSQLPAYKEALKDKIHLVKQSKNESLDSASQTVRELETEIANVTPGSKVDGTKKGAPVLGSSSSHPLSVQVVAPNNPLESVENMFGPLAMAGVVTIFTLFILFSREDLRNRLIRLAGADQLNLVTQAMDEASQRIYKYLLLQFFVNSGYGLLIGISLYLIGIPSAALWGMTAAILRFLPYVGPPLSALMPILLSLAVFPGWYHAAATAALFLVLELVVSNFLEPLLYGAHVGLSPLAILVAAVFWTLVWGLPGLVLSTPLSVCLVVIGRYVPSLNFLNVLLGDEPVLQPHSQYYQRLLAADQNEARQVLEQTLKEKSLVEVYSKVVIPALSLAEEDRHRNELDEESQTFIYQSTREMAEELGDTPINGQDFVEHSNTGAEKNSELSVLCIPARDEADDVVAMLLAQVLRRQGNKASSIPIGSTADMLLAVVRSNPQVLCISALPPFALAHAAALYTKLRAQLPDLHIVICLWHFEGDFKQATFRLGIAEGHALFTTLVDVAQHISFRSRPAATDKASEKSSMQTQV